MATYYSYLSYQQIISSLNCVTFDNNVSHSLITFISKSYVNKIRYNIYIIVFEHEIIFKNW